MLMLVDLRNYQIFNHASKLLAQVKSFCVILELLKANCIGLLILDNPREFQVQFATFIIRKEDIWES